MLSADSLHYIAIYSCSVQNIFCCASIVSLGCSNYAIYGLMQCIVLPISWYANIWQTNFTIYSNKAIRMSSQIILMEKSHVAMNYTDIHRSYILYTCVTFKEILSNHIRYTQ